MEQWKEGSGKVEILRWIAERKMEGYKIHDEK